MGIEGIGSSQPQVNLEQLAGTDVTGKISEEVIADILPLLGEAGNLNVRESTRATDKNAVETAATGEIPELDEADRELIERLAVDLEALVALLQADQTEAEVQSAKDRIESLQGQLKQQHETTMAKINESLEELKDQYQAKIAQEVLGWLGALVAVAMAVVSVLTCGGAAAVFAVVGAVVAVGLQVLNDTGVIEDLTKAIADALKDSGLSKAEAEAVAQVIVAIMELALSLVGVVGSATSAAKAAKDVAKGAAKAAKTLIQVTAKVQKGIQIGFTVATGVMTAMGIASSSASAIINYQTSETQAELTELQAILQKLQQLLDQEESDLKELLEQLMNSLSAVTELLQSKQDALNEISMNIGA